MFSSSSELYVGPRAHCIFCPSKVITSRLELPSPLNTLNSSFAQDLAMREISFFPLVNLVLKIMARGERLLTLIIEPLIGCHEGVRRFD